MEPDSPVRSAPLFPSQQGVAETSTAHSPSDRRIPSSIAAPLPVHSVQQRDIQTLDTHLKKQLEQVPVIRVGLKESAGMGDHTATISLIRSLEAQGFKGDIELILNAETQEWPELRRKLQLLINGYDKEKENDQTVSIGALKCHCIPLPQLESVCRAQEKPLKRPLGVWAMNASRSWLKTDIALVLPPFGWKATEPRIERTGKPHQSIHLPDMAN